MIQWKIGDVRITRIVELELPGLKFIIPNAIPENLRQIDWLRPHFVTESSEPIAAVQTFIVESQGRRIMVDTCIGNDKTLRIKPWCDRKGPFLDDMAEAGFPRESIDTVLCTHLHMDHVGWNTILEGDRWMPTFSQAKYLFGREEWGHWSKQEDKYTGFLVEQSIAPILDSGLHEFVETDHRLTNEVQLTPTPGHTPGHVSVEIESRGERAIITGDLMHHPCQMAHPEWECTADSDGTRAVSTRIGFLNRHAEQPVLVIGTHFAAPTAGRVRRDGKVFRLEVD